MTKKLSTPFRKSTVHKLSKTEKLLIASALAGLSGYALKKAYPTIKKEYLEYRESRNNQKILEDKLPKKDHVSFLESLKSRFKNKPSIVGKPAINKPGIGDSISDIIENMSKLSLNPSKNEEDPLIKQKRIDHYTKVLIKELYKSKVAIKGDDVISACNSYNEFRNFIDKTCRYTGGSLKECRRKRMKEYNIDYNVILEASKMLDCTQSNSLF